MEKAAAFSRAEISNSSLEAQSSDSASAYGIMREKMRIRKLNELGESARYI